jgi:hypothetical protein
MLMDSEESKAGSSELNYQKLRSLNIELYTHTFPKAPPQTTISPLLSDPFCTINVANGPFDLSMPASMTVPFALLSGLAFSSCNYT